MLSAKQASKPKQRRRQKREGDKLPTQKEMADAVKRFEEKRGIKFESFASYHKRKSLSRIGLIVGKELTPKPL